MLKPSPVRDSLEHLITTEILPVAKKYNYAPLSLNLQANWKPIVLVIGNYSSGKSTLINEICGTQVQRTGQAPTDDCFTIITGPDDNDAYNRAIEVLEEVDGRTVVNDRTMPFGGFLKFGSRFVSHFLLKRVNSPKLRNLAIIDSPGMLDSVAEQDRGYEYQEVVGRFAELADLVVLCFDPHRAGTIRETYVSIRSTLPEATSEDRVVFVMNRIDECKNLIDLVRCYGVLCWNVSQMTGRKDIPRIYLTYSPEHASEGDTFAELIGERGELMQKIEQAPRLQVSHLLGTVDNHLHKLELIAGTLANVASKYRRSVLGYVQLAVIATIVATILIDVGVAFLVGNTSNSSIGRMFKGEFIDWPLLLPALLILLSAAGFTYHFRKRFLPRLHERLRTHLDDYAELPTRYARDLWVSVKPLVLDLMADSKNYGLFSNNRATAKRVRTLIDQDVRQLYKRHLGTSQVRGESEVPEPVGAA